MFEAMIVTSKPKRPTSLSLENICYPAFGPEHFKTSNVNKSLRQTKSFSSDLHWQCFSSLDQESQSRTAASGSEPQASLSFIGSSSKPLTLSLDTSLKDEEEKLTISSIDNDSIDNFHYRNLRVQVLKLRQLHWMVESSFISSVFSRKSKFSKF